MVHIVGAGPGATDLITVRGLRLLQQADVVVYAGTLVNRELLRETKPGALLYDSGTMTLEEVMEVIGKAEARGDSIVRLHTGDPSLYGAIREQMDQMEKAGIPYAICPGVSSFCGAAASLHMEYTLPGVSQSLVITRMAGRTPVPERESIRSFAAHRTSMAIFLSAGMLKELKEELILGGYPEDTPAALVYRATWPDERVVHCRLADLDGAGQEAGIRRQALVLVGDAVSQTGWDRSCLYDPGFVTGFRGERTQEAEHPGEECTERDMRQEKAGTLYVVGIGPGRPDQMTAQARQALERSRVIAGYPVYVDLVREYFPGREYITAGMTQEEKRCRLALEAAKEGKDTALVCSGDPQIYGLAGLVLELSGEYPEVRVEVVSGVTAASSGGALLGAPLMGDFAVISLSDRLTPLDEIWNRVEAAAKADFVICLYNPASKGRPDYLKQACRRIVPYRGPDTVCGVVSRIGREGERTEILRLEELAEYPADMFTTVFIGNSKTMRLGEWMVTPRGYRLKGTGSRTVNKESAPDGGMA